MARSQGTDNKIAIERQEERYGYQRRPMLLEGISGTERLCRAAFWGTSRNGRNPFAPESYDQLQVIIGVQTVHAMLATGGSSRSIWVNS